MIIDNPDAFKAWLTTILEPLCDADPAALAKYVYALVKKDKPLEELRDGMLDQLDVFLQQETKPFVDMLFKSLESQEYLAAAAAAAAARPPTPPPEPPADDIKLETENDIHAPVTVPAPPRPRSPPARHRVVVRAKPAPPPPPPLPRAPPMEQTLVKVLPLTELLEEPVDQPPRRRDRRPDMIRDGGDRRRRRSRSWERRARARRPPRDEHERRDDRGEIRRRMSRSPSPRGRYRNRSPPAPAIGLDRSRSRSPAPVRERERDHDRDRDRLRVPREMERDRMSRDRDRVSRSRDRDRSHDRSRERSLSPHKDRHEISDAFKRRCRDFDEKGYCMRGDLCQWDHGVDPVVLEDAALTRVLTLPPPVPEYNPLTPDIWCGNAFPAYGAPPPRELIPIPRYARPVRHDPPGPQMSLPPPRHPNPIKKSFDYNRIGANRLGSSLGGQCALEVKKVPRGLNDITHLNNHFSKFGKIVNIQVCFKEDPEGALITFATPAEASVAYKSTEAVLNNRFIKVFWHNPEQNKLEPPPAHAAPAPAAPHGSHNKVLINRENVRATHNTKMAAAAKAKETALAKEPLAANGQEPRKDGPAPPAATPTGQAAVPQRDNKVVEMSRRAQALLETQLQQQRLLIERLEKGNVSEPQRAALMEAINSSQEGIENLRRELLAYNNSLRQMQEETVSRSMSRLQLAQTKKPKTREEAQKEILDAELDMFTKQQEGQDVTELMKKVAELRRQMSLQFPSHNTIRRPHARGGRFAVTARPRGGGAAGKVFANQSVDHRPRALLVSGFEPDELDALVGHFSQFGEITGKEVRLAVPELVLQYRARAHAEHAALRGRHYNDRTLTITWVTSTKPIAALPAANGDVAAARDNSDEASTIADNVSAALSRDDDEDDEEEDRSWRR